MRWAAMKKILLRRLPLVSLLLLSSASRAQAYEVWRSSFTQTADSNQSLCSKHRAILHSVCISSPTAAASTLKVFLSTNTPVQAASIDATQFGCLNFDTVVASTNTNSLAYTNSSTANVFIEYECY